MIKDKGDKMQCVPPLVKVAIMYIGKVSREVLASDERVWSHLVLANVKCLSG